MDFREITEFLKDFAGFIFTFLVMVLIFAFVIALQPVAGNSMHSTLKEGDVVVVSRFSYKIGKPKRNEIVTVKDDDKKSYIKRVIGLPGEKIHYLNGVLYINDEPQRETFLDEGMETGNFMFEDICPKEKCPNGVIPEEMYMLMGDNRLWSVDSRTPEFGLRNIKDIDGKVLVRIWPLNTFGSVK